MSDFAIDPAEETHWELSPGDEESVEISDDDSSSDPSTQPLNAPTPNILTEARVREIEEGLRAEVAREREERQALERRLRDTQSWGNQRHQEASLAQQLLEANRQARFEAENEARRQRELAPPSLSPEEREVLGGILDPDLLERKFHEYSAWGARNALAQLAPDLERAKQTQQQLGALTQVLPAMIQQGRSQALAAALSRVVDEGEMTYEEAESIVPAVYENFERYGGPEGAINASLDPNVVATALGVYHRYKNGGVKPVGQRQAPKPRSLGTSNSLSSSGGSGSNGRIQVSAAEAAEIRKVEAELGHRLPVDSIRSVLASRR